MEEELNRVIKLYFDYKNEFDDFKKQVDMYNKDIKDVMNKLDVTEFITDNGLQAKLTVQNRESFKEPELIEKLLELKQNDIVELVPTINYDKLEDAIYNGKINASILSAFKETKQVITLKVSKKKGE